MIPILNSSAGRVSGIGSEGGFERLNTSIFFFWLNLNLNLILVLLYVPTWVYNVFTFLCSQFFFFFCVKGN